MAIPGKSAWWFATYRLARSWLSSPSVKTVTEPTAMVGSVSCGTGPTTSRRAGRLLSDRSLDVVPILAASMPDRQARASLHVTRSAAKGSMSLGPGKKATEESAHGLGSSGGPGPAGASTARFPARNHTRPPLDSRYLRVQLSCLRVLQPHLAPRTPQERCLSRVGLLGAPLGRRVPWRCRPSREAPLPRPPGPQGTNSPAPSLVCRAPVAPGGAGIPPCLAEDGDPDDASRLGTPQRPTMLLNSRGPGGVNVRGIDAAAPGACATGPRDGLDSLAPARGAPSKAHGAGA
eukprot:CAMPEP_0175239114 /NCGR_PEP_ID=MMETSP0093-20121207/29379_1 /TAXON_ID=311494 /ORGANISM="Alexandrium monilatum, Strain CCMP3105" /LENGTH=289 /DNA_ID=CAMNT_0016533135 /DNA_START=74 /DNA_END=941 /DNA_ORIENTATION=-